MSNTTKPVSFRECREVTLLCPVTGTILGYYPNMGANAFLAAAFGLCLFGLVYFGIKKRTWGYSAALTVGCSLEFIGYLARALMNKNPWNSGAFQAQLCAIIIAPSFICISIYLTIKHVTLSVNPELSRIRPRLYPLIFVPADISCLVLQGIGGGVAAGAAFKDPDLLKKGDNIIVAGIVLQVVVLLFFGAMGSDYLFRARRWVRGPEATPQALALWEDKKFRMFWQAVAAAYACILIRCIYRIAEMAEGWGNKIMRDEPSFIVLEGFMILIPVILLTAFTPGVLFPDMAQREGQRFRRKRGEKSEVVTPSGDESPSP